MIWEPKDPDEVVFRSIPWEGPLAGDEIASSDLTVLAGTVALSDIVTSADKITATVSGGLALEVAVLRSLVTSVDGRTLEQIITMHVRDTQDVETPDGPSTAPKGTVVEMAYEVMTLAGYSFDLTDEERSSALRALDVLMAEMSATMALGYNAPARIGEGDLSDASGLPDMALNAISQQLALRIMPAIGKTESQEARLSRAISMTALRAAFAVVPDRSFNRNTPIGAGNKPRSTWSPFAGRYGQ